MEQSVGVGVIGDFDPQCVSHVATNAALHHAAATLNLTLNVRWVPTPELDQGSAPARLSSFHGLLCSPGSPYRSMNGALAGITFARERGWPFFVATLFLPQLSSQPGVPHPLLLAFLKVAAAFRPTRASWIGAA